ncbi:hypothetical protein [Bradyrhizobium sp. Ash2021]|uniref:hypothetical protein n=1 Tax=Bradyrhizobium sp. Ash2021 TaxID=2954771 RepID=UPI0028151005|nr:hypothetical protein [Bradyrhizobium sp. Ash2021]WMT78745.1 hypothetical protein NL528_21440 [Bradyrhizobium sp. Ash2021]
MWADKAQRDLLKATLPPSADAYKLELPADFKPPGGDGVEFKFDASNAGLAAVRNLAHAKGWSQADLSDVLSIYAAHTVQQEAALTAARNAEIAKLGASGPVRIDSITRWLRAEIGDVDAKPILATLVTSAHVRMFERIMGKISSQGASSFSQSHRVAPDQSVIPGYEKMSFEQRRHAQDQLAQRR